MPYPVQIEPEEVLEKCFLDRPDHCEPRHAPEVAEIMDCSTGAAREKLEILVEHGDLRSKKLGAWVFWRPCLTEDVGTDE